jgi:DNA-binding MarR family transcriptional regulator
MPDPVIGANARAAIRHPIDGSKGRKVLVLIAAWLDAGVDDPAISRIAKRARLPKEVTSDVVDRLERDGLIAIRRGDKTRRERNHYSLTLDHDPGMKEN